MAAIDHLITHEFVNPQPDDSGPHDHNLPSDNNNGHILSGGSIDGDLLCWTPGNTSKGGFRTLTAGAGISITIAPTTITIAASGVPTGSGSTNFHAKWTSSTALGTSLIQDNGTSLAFNGAPSTRYQSLFAGSFTGSGGDVAGVTVSPAVTGPSGNQVYGLWVNTPTLTVTGAPAVNASLRVDAPSNSQAGAANAASLYVSGAPSGATVNAALLVNSGLTKLSSNWTFDGTLMAVNIANTAQVVIGALTAPFSYVQMTLTGTFSPASTNAEGLGMFTTLNPPVGGLGVGIVSHPTINKAGSGTHPVFASSYFEPPTIGAGASILTLAATLYLRDAPTGGTNNFALYGDGGSTFTFLGSQPYSVGGATRTYAGMTHRGTIVSDGVNGITIGALFEHTLQPVNNDIAAIAAIFQATITKPTGGTINPAAGLYLTPPTLGGSGTATNGAALWITAATTGATNNYAFYSGGRSRFDAGVDLFLTSPAYSASITIDASLADTFRIVATNNTGFTVNTPTNAPVQPGKKLVIMIKNTSGGALGVLTFGGGYKIGAAWTQPGNGFSRSIEFVYDGTNWIETFRSAADVSN